jgi:hypothetical protein
VDNDNNFVVGGSVGMSCHVLLSMNLWYTQIKLFSIHHHMHRHPFSWISWSNDLISALVS